MTAVADVEIPASVAWRYSSTTKAKTNGLLQSLGLDARISLTFSEVCALRTIIDHERLLRHELPADHRSLMFTTVAENPLLQAGQAPEWILYGRSSGSVYLEHERRDLTEPNVSTRFTKFVVDPVRRKWEELTGGVLEVA